MKVKNKMACKVELREHGNSWYDKEVAFKKMLAAFNKLVADVGNVQKVKDNRYYESKGERKRRRKKECLKEKLRNNFMDKQ